MLSNTLFISAGSLYSTLFERLQHWANVQMQQGEGVYWVIKGWPKGIEKASQADWMEAISAMEGRNRVWIIALDALMGEGTHGHLQKVLNRAAAENWQHVLIAVHDSNLSMASTPRKILERRWELEELANRAQLRLLKYTDVADLAIQVTSLLDAGWPWQTRGASVVPNPSNLDINEPERGGEGGTLSITMPQPFGRRPPGGGGSVRREIDSVEGGDSIDSTGDLPIGEPEMGGIESLPQAGPEADFPSRGVVRYHLPRRMQVGHHHQCVVAVAIDLTSLDLDWDEDIHEHETEEGIRVSSKMSCTLDGGGAFAIDPKSPEEQPLERDAATEWRFEVKPLAKGSFRIYLKLFILLQGNQRKEKSFDTAVEVVTEPVADAADVVELNLDSGVQEQLKLRILFLSASPADLAKLAMTSEMKQIRATLDAGRGRRESELLFPELDMTFPEMVKALAQRPEVVHFSGHGEQGGIYVANSSNNAELVELPALSQLFGQLKGSTHLVILNACYTGELACEISKFGMHVAGFNEAVTDSAAMAFSKGLYIGLGEGKAVTDAIKDGLALIVQNNAKWQSVLEVWKDGSKVML